MEWIKKKKDEAKQAAAKLQNKRAAFKGEGNVLGGGADAQSEASAAPAAARTSGAGIKMPSFGRSAPPALTPEEQQRRREQQQKALEQRTNAWEKRVDKARKARLQQEEENAARLGVSLPPPPPVSASSETSVNLPPPVVLSNEEVKAREIHNAHAQMGFNPYAATFSSSSEATSAMNSIGGAPPPNAPPAAASSTAAATSAAFPAPGLVAEHLGGLTVEESESGGAVYVLLRQEPARAITAAETLIKLLSNIVKNPDEEKFRRVRLSNAAIQSKLVSVNGAVDILREAGFSDAVLDDEPYLMLVDLDVGRVQSAVDRTEVALIQLQHDSADA